MSKSGHHILFLVWFSVQYIEGMVLVYEAMSAGQEEEDDDLKRLERVGLII